ncbi:MAG TPA: LpqB family beta-propeller domain-containing protein [Glaciibacter sp.]|nr:LpqB family beta-propeller domain-containing protein [Glaciibacter sp.]
MPKGLRLAGILTALALVMTGCSSIPSDGAVRAGQLVEPDDNPPPIFLPSLPEKGGSPESIVRGFIGAASSPEDNYAIARKFLTTDSTWDPNAGVTVDDGSARPAIALDDKTVQLSVNPVAEVDATGVYGEVESPSPVFLRYRLAQVAGEWRITEAPPGIVIDRSTFSQVFSPEALYFFDPSFRYLVPDLRWYPRGPTTPTRIVKGLLAGPSPWLVGAVATAFPAGTNLTADAVQVVARDAKVDLDSEALSADRVAMQRMQAQLGNSLPAGLTVSITINQNSQDITESETNAPIVNPRVDARALVLRDGAFGFLASTGEALTTIPGLSESISAMNPRAVTLAPGQTVAAVLADGGVHRVAVGDAPEILDPRQGLVPPSVDTYGYVWSVPMERPGELFVYNPEGAAIAVPTTWPEATSIHSLRLSRDGTRLAALLRTGSDTRFVVAAVKRDKNVPVGLGDPETLATIEGTPLDATWIDDLTVASLSQLPNGEERIVAQQIGGVRTSIASAPDTVSITGGNTMRELRALSAPGALLVQRGVGWQVRIGGIDMVATQQGDGSG